MMKKCYNCKIQKELRFFGKDKSRKDKLRLYCKDCVLKRDRSYRAKNKNKHREYAKKYRIKNKDNPVYKKKKAEQDRKYREKNKDKIRRQAESMREERNAKRRQNRRRQLLEDPIPFLIESSRRRAKKRDMEHTITASDIKIPRNCPVLGIPIFVGSGRACPNSPSLDRIDSSKGYTRENVIVVSWRANDLKRDATVEEMRKLYYFYKEI